MNDLGHEVAEAAGADRVAVLGSGHPQADIFLLKHRPQTAELHEGVAFFGRTGQAILKSLQRLHVDPTAIYGTNAVKYDGQDEEEAAATLRRELHVVQPKLVVAMGQDAVSCLNAAQFPLARTLEDRTGEMQAFTPTIEALVTPDIDTALDEAPTKRAFWNAFKAIGPWWSEQPPY
jgi:uracil-DNA glycosylase family 4